MPAAPDACTSPEKGKHTVLQAWNDENQKCTPVDWKHAAGNTKKCAAMQDNTFGSGNSMTVGTENPRASCIIAAQNTSLWACNPARHHHQRAVTHQIGETILVQQTDRCPSRHSVRATHKLARLICCVLTHHHIFFCMMLMSTFSSRNQMHKNRPFLR